MRLPELQVGGALEHLAHTLLVLHAGQLDADAAAEGLLLDAGLRHAELVDTGPQDALGVREGGIGLPAERIEVVIVAALAIEHALAVGRIEYGRERRAVLDLGVLLTEEGHEVQVVGELALAGVGQGGGEGRVAAVLAKVLDQLGDAHLEGHGHPALQVKAQVDLLLLALAVGVAQHRIDPLLGVGAQVGILEVEHQAPAVLACAVGRGQHGIGLELSGGAGLAFQAGGEIGEGELIRARERQQDGEDPERASILHDRRGFLKEAANIEVLPFGPLKGLFASPSGAKGAQRKPMKRSGSATIHHGNDTDL